MAACSHGATYEGCPPKSVAQEFHRADKGTGVISRKHGLTHFPHKQHSRNGR